MAGIKSKKQKVFGEIGAAKTLTSGMPTFRLDSSYPSINNRGDSILFLTDLLKSLVGQQELIKKIVEFLTKYLNKIEITLKKIIKDLLKGILSCGTNPSIPSFLKSTGTGVVVKVDKLDFFDLFKVDPYSLTGPLLYNNITSPYLTTSKDFNTFLYGVIQENNPTVVHSWKNKSGQNILDVKFETSSVGNANNSFIFKVNSNYDEKSLLEFNNDFVDSIEILNAKDMVNRIIDTLFGSISLSMKKTKKQLQKEAEVNAIIDKLTNAAVNNELDNFYFEFSNEEIAKIQTQVDDRKKGIIKIRTSTTVEANMPIEYLQNLTVNLNTTSTISDQANILTDSLNSMGDNLASQTQNIQDKQTIKIGFITELVKSLIKAVSNAILSPKVVIIFLLNYKILYGVNASYNGPVDFIKQNKALFIGLFKEVNTLVVTFLMTIAMKEITKLAGDAALVKITDRLENKKQQLLSLIGIPQDVLRMIKGFL
jgi:hypothetical protein